MKVKSVLKGVGVALPIGAMLFVAPVFYNTWIFLHTNTVSYPDRTHPESTEFYLIGTRHYLTPTFNSDTLYQYLEKIQPDLILMELTPPRFRGDRIKWMYRLEMSFYSFLQKYKVLEPLAATKYANQHPNTVIRPFEWVNWINFRDSIDYYGGLQKMNENYAKALNAGILNQNDSNILERSAKSHRIKKGIEITMGSINSSQMDSLMTILNHYRFHALPKFILSQDTFQDIHAFANVFLGYWEKRNTAMKENILKAIDSNRNKRIVVLTGYGHRKLLGALLSKESNNYGFKLLDYRVKI
ncbi:MAG: hypothetical protein JXQ90_12000 [Cyclobacteriaceae bacterium]